jgi:hypothetical protein
MSNVEWGKLSSKIDIAEVYKHPDLPWDKSYLSVNRGITLDLILHSKLPNATGQWGWRGPSAILHINDIRQNLRLPWSKQDLSRNKTITVDFIDNDTLELSYNSRRDDWKWSRLSQHIDIAEVIGNPIKPWDRSYLSRNVGITVECVDNLHLPNATGNWDWMEISKVVSIDEVWSNPEASWHRYGLSLNSNITVDTVDNLHLPNATGEWNWYSLSEVINMDEVSKHPSKPWVTTYLARNRGVTVEIIESCHIDWLNLSQTVNVEVFRQCKYLPWFPEWITGVTIDDLSR